MRCNFVPSLLWFEFGQLNSSRSILIGFLCAAAFSSFFWVCKSDISFCNTKQQFGCPIIQSFFPWPPFPPSDSYPADCVCVRTKTHAHPFFSDWLAVTARRFALPRYGTQRHKASEAVSTTGLIISLSLCAARPPTCSTRISAAFHLTYTFVHLMRHRSECGNSLQ